MELTGVVIRRWVIRPGSFSMRIVWHKPHVHSQVLTTWVVGTRHAVLAAFFPSRLYNALYDARKRNEWLDGYYSLRSRIYDVKGFFPTTQKTLKFRVCPYLIAHITTNAIPHWETFRPAKLISNRASSSSSPRPDLASPSTSTRTWAIACPSPRLSLVHIT